MAHVSKEDGRRYRQGKAAKRGLTVSELSTLENHTYTAPIQAETVLTATRTGVRWTRQEVEEVLTSPLRPKVLAVYLGRTLYAVYMMKRKLAQCDNDIAEYEAAYGKLPVL